MILLLTACGLAGLATGQLVGWMARKKYRDRLATLKAKTASELSGAAPTPPIAPPMRLRPTLGGEHLAGFSCQLGDVIVLAHGEEAWLAGAIVLAERTPDADEAGRFQRNVAALFVAPDAGVGRAVYARSDPQPTLDWMWPLPSGAIVSGHEPPSAIEHDGAHFERVRRLPLLASARGEGAPDIGASVVVGEYEGGAGSRLLVVIAPSGTWAWRGRRLEPGMFDLLPAPSS